MTNANLNVLLASVLDDAGSDRAKCARIMKRFALAQALAVEEQLTDDETHILSAAAALYELNDEKINPADSNGNFSPIVIADYIKNLLDDANLPVFEASAIGSLIAMQKHGLAIENTLHRLLLDINILVTLDTENVNTVQVKEAARNITSTSAKRRLTLMFDLTSDI